jgi:hypothetical protein
MESPSVVLSFQFEIFQVPGIMSDFSIASIVFYFFFFYQGRQYIHNSSVFVGGPYLILLYKHHILFQIDFTAMGKNISWLKVEIVYGVEGM